MTNGIRDRLHKLGYFFCAHCINYLLLEKNIYIFDLCCLVYNVVLKQTIPMDGNDEIYVDLHDEDNTQNPNAPVMAMLHSLQ